MNFPSCENLTILAFVSPPWPSATKMSPFGATATSLGSLNLSGAVPRTPAVPSVSSTFPSRLNLKTWCPLPSASRASVTHTAPSRST
jgi:hypothetical protein